MDTNDLIDLIESAIDDAASLTDAEGFVELHELLQNLQSACYYRWHATLARQYGNVDLALKLEEQSDQKLMLARTEMGRGDV